MLTRAYCAVGAPSGLRDRGRVTKPGIDQLLIRSALEPELCRRLRESPDDAFADFDLSEEEKEVLRSPDHRLLPLLGAALARQMQPSDRVAEAPAAATAAPTQVDAHAATDTTPQALPDTLMVLTVVPCALHEAGQFKGITYVMFMSPLPEGTDPASLKPPAGTTFPGPNASLPSAMVPCGPRMHAAA